MDKAYEGDAIRGQVVSYGLVPVVPPKATARSLGNTTRRFTNVAMKWNVTSGE